MAKGSGCDSPGSSRPATHVRPDPSTKSCMAKKTDCYVDTSAFIAFLDRSDSFHPLFRRLFAEPPPLVTSSLVIVEGHSWFLRRYDTRRAIQFLGFVSELGMLAIRPFDNQELARAACLIRK